MVIYFSENVGILNLCITLIYAFNLILFYFHTWYFILYFGFLCSGYPFTICQHVYRLVSLFFHRYGSFEDCEGERNQCPTGESRGAVRTWVLSLSWLSVLKWLPAALVFVVSFPWKLKNRGQSLCYCVCMWVWKQLEINGTDEWWRLVAA